jgi:apolipoprotein N-acyltransferase
MKLNDTVSKAILCSVLTGALFAASRDIAPFGTLIFVAPIAILLYALSSDRLWRVFAASFVARAIGAAALVYAYAGALPPIILAVVIAAASVEFATVIVLTRLATQRLPVWAATLSFPIFATAAEFLAQLPSANGTFGALGYALSDVRALVQAASVGGVAAVSFIAALVPMTIVLLIRTPAHWRSVIVTGALPVVVALVFGAWRLSLPYEARTRVALASIDSLTFRSVREPAQASHVADAYARAIATLEGQRLEAVILPERVFVDATGTSADASARLQDAANRIGARIVAGFDEALEDGRHANTARVFSPQAPRLTYVKRKLIPNLESELVPGSGPLLIDDRAVAICKDLDFAPMIREYGRRGTSLMFVPAWDFELDGRLHARMAVMRGVENGFAMARAAATGRLTVSDAFGRIVAEANTSHQAPVILMAEVGLTSKRTIYSRIGDVFAWLIVVAAAGLLIWMAPATRARYMPVLGARRNHRPDADILAHTHTRPR